MSTAFDYGTGRRKTAIARTRLYPGSGQIEVNGRPMDQYFPRKTLQMIVRQPLALTKLTEQYDIKVNVCGGGISGQAVSGGIVVLSNVVMVRRGQQNLLVRYCH